MYYKFQEIHKKKHQATGLGVLYGQGEILLLGELHQQKVMNADDNALDIVPGRVRLPMTIKFFIKHKI